MENHITKEDLMQFRKLLLDDFEKMFRSNEESKEEQNNEDLEWLRSKAIRRIMDISPGTLQNLRVTGRVRHRKIMGSYYYNKSDVVNLFNNGQDRY